MACTKGIVFGATRKTGNPIRLAQVGHGFTATGEDFMDVGLVADVPDNAVVWRVEYVMQRKRQLHRTEVGGQVSACLGNRIHQESAQFGRQLRQFGRRQGAQVIR